MCNGEGGGVCLPCPFYILAYTTIPERPSRRQVLLKLFSYAAFVEAVVADFSTLYLSVPAGPRKEGSERPYECEPRCQTHEYFDEKRDVCKPRAK